MNDRSGARLTSDRVHIAGAPNSIPAPITPVDDADPTQPELPSWGLLSLNLGCGPLSFVGEVGVDRYETSEVSVVADISMLPFADDSTEFVRLDHVLEHMPVRMCAPVLLEARRVLADGGYIRVGVPDLKSVCQEYVSTSSLYSKALLLRNLYGNQVHDGEYHKSGWDEQTLSDLLKSCGFGVHTICMDPLRDEGTCIVAWAYKQ